MFMLHTYTGESSSEEEEEDVLSKIDNDQLVILVEIDNESDTYFRAFDQSDLDDILNEKDLDRIPYWDECGITWDERGYSLSNRFDDVLKLAENGKVNNIRHIHTV